jgi:hypothetical protein
MCTSGYVAYGDLFQNAQSKGVIRADIAQPHDDLGSLLENAEHVADLLRLLRPINTLVNANGISPNASVLIWLANVSKSARQMPCDGKVNVIAFDQDGKGWIAP